MIFVDTGAWFAVAVKNDPDHSAAMRWLSANREPLVTTDYVLAETATLIRMNSEDGKFRLFRSTGDEGGKFPYYLSSPVLNRKFGGVALL